MGKKYALSGFWYLLDILLVGSILMTVTQTLEYLCKLFFE